MKYEKILKRYNLLYRIQSDKILCQVKDKEIGKVYKLVLKNTNKRLVELNSSNLHFLHILIYLYEDSQPAANLDQVELLFDIFKRNWLHEIVLLKSYLKLLSDVKIEATIEKCNLRIGTIEVKFILKYSGKQYTFYRMGVLSDTSLFSVKKEYLNVLIDLRDSLLGLREKDELFLRYNSILTVNMRRYIELSLLNNNLSILSNDLVVSHA